MRDQLEEALRHSSDGVGRVQAQSKAALPRRFYTAAGYRALDGGFALTLDGRVAQTPGRSPITVPTAALAEALAAEWDQQVGVIDHRLMPVTRLVNSAIESGLAREAAFREEIVKYCGNDLLLYRAGFPTDLVAAQDSIWDPVLTGLARHFGVAFQPTIGITHQPQPVTTLSRLGRSLEDEGYFALTAMVSMTGITGSGLLTIAYRQGLLTAEAALTAAFVDEDHNIRLWGQDAEAAHRRTRQEQDFYAAVAVLRWLQG